MMLVPPYARRVYLSPFSPQEIAERLSAGLSPERHWSHRFLFRGDGLYKGRVTMETFMLVRDARKRFFKPVVAGCFSPREEGGSRVIVVFRLHALAVLFAVPYLLLALFWLAQPLFSGKGPLIDGLLVPGFMLFFCFVVCVVPFRQEALFAEALLTRMLSLEPEERHDSSRHAI